MWLRAAHSRAPSRALAWFLAFLVCGSAFEWQHLGDDDRGCGLVLTTHDHAAHRLAGDRQLPPSTDHCYICHSLRLLHAALAITNTRAELDGRSSQFTAVTAGAPRQAFLIDVPSRAPPLVLC